MYLSHYFKRSIWVNIFYSTGFTWWKLKIFRQMGLCFLKTCLLGDDLLQFVPGSYPSSHFDYNSHRILPQDGTYLQSKWVNCLLVRCGRSAGQRCLKKHASTLILIRSHCWLCRICRHLRHLLFPLMSQLLYHSFALFPREVIIRNKMTGIGLNRQFHVKSSLFLPYSRLFSEYEVAIHRIDDLLISWRETSLSCFWGK